MSKPNPNLSLDNREMRKIAQLGGKLGTFLSIVNTMVYRFQPSLINLTFLAISPSLTEQ